MVERCHHAGQVQDVCGRDGVVEDIIQRVQEEAVGESPPAIRDLLIRLPERELLKIEFVV